LKSHLVFEFKGKIKFIEVAYFGPIMLWQMRQMGLFPPVEILPVTSSVVEEVREEDEDEEEDEVQGPKL
jgi:hypothetical protein